MDMRGYVAAMVCLLLVSSMGTAAVGTSVSDQAFSQDVSPGEEVAGALMVGEAEIKEEVTVRGFGHQLQAAEDAEERAALIAERIEADEERLASAEERLAELEQQREAGEISPGQYRAEVAVTSVVFSGIERNAEQSGAFAPDLAEHLEERGVPVERIESLREQAGKVSGQEIRDIATEIRGPPGPGALDTPANVTPGPDDDVPANQSDQDSVGETIVDEE